MKKLHEIEKVVFSNDKILLVVDGAEYSFDLFKISTRLARADRNERENFQVSPCGYGIHWPLIDEDLSIDGLVSNARKLRGKE